MNDSYFMCVFVCVRVDAAPENTPESEVTVAEPEPKGLNLDLHCDENIDDGKSTRFHT